LAFLKPDFESMAVLNVFGFFSKRKKAREIWIFSVFFEVFGFDSKIKKGQAKSVFFLDLFQNNTSRICS